MALKKLTSVLPVPCGFVLLLCLTACVTLATNYRKVGFREMQKGFSALEKTEALHEIIELEKIRVHIVGDRKYFTWDRAATPGSTIMGYATRNNDIYIFGTEVKGKIVVNQAILGHEINHLLNYKNSRMAHPDQLDDLGA